jgi:hypothetical protein
MEIHSRINSFGIEEKHDKWPERRPNSTTASTVYLEKGTLQNIKEMLRYLSVPNTSLTCKHLQVAGR